MIVWACPVQSFSVLVAEGIDTHMTETESHCSQTVFWKETDRIREEAEITSGEFEIYVSYGHLTSQLTTHSPKSPRAHLWASVLAGPTLTMTLPHFHE
jgi:hypothetical protein